MNHFSASFNKIGSKSFVFQKKQKCANVPKGFIQLFWGTFLRLLISTFW